MQLSFRGEHPETIGSYLLRLEYRVRYYRFFFLPPLYLALPFFFLALRQTAAMSGCRLSVDLRPGNQLFSGFPVSLHGGGDLSVCFWSAYWTLQQLVRFQRAGGPRRLSYFVSRSLLSNTACSCRAAIPGRWPYEIRSGASLSTNSSRRRPAGNWSSCAIGPAISFRMSGSTMRPISTRPAWSGRAIWEPPRMKSCAATIRIAPSGSWSRMRGLRACGHMRPNKQSSVGQARGLRRPLRPPFFFRKTAIFKEERGHGPRAGRGPAPRFPQMRSNFREN